MSYEPLSERRVQILHYIIEYKNERGYAPNEREVAKGVGLKSVSTAAYHIKRLAVHGFLRHHPGVGRGLTNIIDPEHSRSNFACFDTP